MPQKKNPDSLELIRGKSGRVIGDVSTPYIRLCMRLTRFFDIIRKMQTRYTNSAIIFAHQRGN